MKMRVLYKLLTELQYFKAYMVVQILVQITLAPVVPILGTIGNVLIVLWGAAIVIYDFFHEKRLFQNKTSFLLYLFMAAVLLSILVNAKNVVDNVQALAIVGIQFMVLYPSYCKTDQELSKSVFTFVNVYAAVMLLCSLAGFVLFCLNRPIYLYSYRFSGVFSSPNISSVLSILGGVSSAVALTDSSRLHRFRGLFRTLHIVGIVLNFIMFTLSNSHTGQVMLLALSLVTAFFYAFHRFAQKKTVLFRVGISLVLSVAVAGGTLLCFTGVQKGAAYLPSLVEMLEGGGSSGSGGQPQQGLEAKDFNRDKDDAQLDNNRFTIWKQGMKTFVHAPVLGCGPRNLDAAVKTYVENPRSEIEAGGLHNMFLEILVTTGVVGFILFLAFALAVAWLLLKFFFHAKSFAESSKAETAKWTFLFGMAASLVVMNLTESAMLFSVNVYSMCFWIFLGYLINFRKLHSSPSKLS